MFTISVNPVAFTIGSHEIRWYGIIIAIAVAVVILWMVRQVDKRKAKLPVPPDMMPAPVGIVSGIIGAKLLHVLERADYYLQHPAEIFSGGGFAIYGGVLGATLGIWIYIKLSRRHLKNQHFGFYIDLVTPGIILAQAIGRIGCTINGCCYGKPAPDWLPWSVAYTHPNHALQGTPVNIPLHPTQVYEIIFCLAGFAILLKIRGQLEAMEGALFLVYLILYSAWRFGVGYLRTDLQFIFGLSQAQIISLVVLGVAIFLLIRMRRRFQTSEQKSGSGENFSPPTTLPAG
jgi:phosphatidylglycerol:prolipoprotein diacylglycerol transferase